MGKLTGLKNSLKKIAFKTEDKEIKYKGKVIDVHIIYGGDGNNSIRFVYSEKNPEYHLLPDRMAFIADIDYKQGTLGTPEMKQKIESTLDAYLEKMSKLASGTSSSEDETNQFFGNYK